MTTTPGPITARWMRLQRFRRKSLFRRWARALARYAIPWRIFTAPSGSGWSELETRLLGFVRGLTRTDLERVFEYKTLKFGVYSNPLWESMQHLVNHGTYHRGQVTTLLRQLGAQPMATDLMHFYRERATAASA